MLTEHQDYMPAPEEFDFSVFDEIFDKFPGYCDVTEENPVLSRERMELLLNPKAMQAYMSWCLTKNKKFTAPLVEKAEIKEKTAPDFSNPNHIRYLQDAFIIGRERLKGTLPLRENEYDQAIHNLQETPELYRAITTYKSLITGYLSCLQERAHKSSLFDKDASEFVQRSLHVTMMVIHNGIRTGFNVEFAPLLGLHAEKGNINFPNAIHRMCAAPSAFKAVSLNDGQEKKAVCPFMNTGIKSLTTKFDPNTGQQTGRIHGGIIIAIMDKYRVLESDASPAAKPADP